MNKIFSKNNLGLLAGAILGIGSFLVGATSTFAAVSGKDLSADVGAADLSGIVSNWPYLILIGLVIVVLLILVSRNKTKKMN